MFMDMLPILFGCSAQDVILNMLISSDAVNVLKGQGMIKQLLNQSIYMTLV